VGLWYKLGVYVGRVMHQTRLFGSPRRPGEL